MTGSELVFQRESQIDFEQDDYNTTIIEITQKQGRMVGANIETVRRTIQWATEQRIT